MVEQPPEDLGQFEEDDEFEEFKAENWDPEEGGEGENDEIPIWEDNWEDDVVEDDFQQKLKEQLEKLKAENSA